MFLLLSFLPNEDVQLGFSMISQYITEHNLYNLKEFLTYFSINHLRMVTDVFEAALIIAYDIHFWNVYDRIKTIFQE